MRYYPVFLDIADKPVVIIGGGTIAEQKVGGLLDAGAKVTIVSPELNETLTDLRDAGKLTHIVREYEAGDIEGYELVVVATDSRAENEKVWAEGRERHIWVNAVDDVPNCDFIMPGIVRQGDLTLAISTAGKSPAMARKVREDLETFLSEDDSALLDLAAEVRSETRDRGIDVEGCPRCQRDNLDVWNAALDGIVKKLLQEGKRDEAKARVLDLLFSPSGQAIPELS
ncbi:MAG TPA: bifunctional precorrin-2 dehydrogenase/sirohydrochlorin ferrochelatase [Dehalococcoidia bacterium]